jgi:outer membrane protein assembly factor BamB
VRFAKIFAFLTLTSGVGLAGDHWPQFRGPTGQGHADSTGLPLAWSETENVAWKTAIPGRGWSSPVVEEGQIWLTTATDEGRKLSALAVDVASGRIVHEVPLFEVDTPLKINAKNSHASPTSVIEPGRVYVHFGTTGTACLDTKTGKVQWTNQELQLDHKEGPGSSPILWNGLLIVNCDGIDVQYVAALDKSTGKLVWKADRPGPLNANPDFRKAYGTPLVIRRNGRDELVSNGADQVIGYDPATGRQLWRLGYQGFSNVPRPVAGPDLVYLATGYNKPQMWAFRPPAAEGQEPEVVWRCLKQAPSNPSPVLVGDRLYMVSDQGVLTCLDAATGKQVWTERIGGSYSASLLCADGRIYIFSEDGQTTVVQPGDRFELLARNTLDGSIMATPAVVGSAIFVRTDSHLYRIESTPARTAELRDAVPGT